MPVQVQTPHIPSMKGAWCMRDEPNIVETYRIGGSTIQIADNYVRTDPTEIERILDNMHQAAWKIIQSCRVRREDI